MAKPSCILFLWLGLLLSASTWLHSLLFLPFRTLLTSLQHALYWRTLNKKWKHFSCFLLTVLFTPLCLLFIVLVAPSFILYTLLILYFKKDFPFLSIRHFYMLSSMEAGIIVSLLSYFQCMEGCFRNSISICWMNRWIWNISHRNTPNKQ